LLPPCWHHVGADQADPVPDLDAPGHPGEPVGGAAPRVAPAGGDSERVTVDAPHLPRTVHPVVLVGDVVTHAELGGGGGCCGHDVLSFCDGRITLIRLVVVSGRRPRL